MIVYAKYGLWPRLMGSVLPRTIPQSIISPLIALALALAYADPERTRDEPVVSFYLSSYVHQLGMLVVSFLLVCRVQTAVKRCALYA
jgi:hypothetical protein